MIWHNKIVFKFLSPIQNKSEKELIYHDRNNSGYNDSLYTLFFVQKYVSDQKQRRRIWTNLCRTPVWRDE